MTRSQDFNIPDNSALVLHGDNTWSAGGGGGVASVTATSPATSTGGANPDIGFNQAVAIGNNARVAVAKNSAAATGTRRQLNLIEGTNITLTVADDAANERVNVTIDSAGGGSGLTHPQVLARAFGGA